MEIEKGFRDPAETNLPLLCALRSRVSLRRRLSWRKETISLSAGLAPFASHMIDLFSKNYRACSHPINFDSAK